MNDNKTEEMTAEDVCRIFVKNYPETFGYWYKQIKLIWESEHGIFKDKTLEEEMYWNNENLNFARTILYDFTKDSAHKIGKILVDATE